MEMWVLSHTALCTGQRKHSKFSASPVSLFTEIDNSEMEKWRPGTWRQMQESMNLSVCVCERDSNTWLRVREKPKRDYLTAWKESCEPLVCCYRASTVGLFDSWYSSGDTVASRRLSEMKVSG